MTKTEELIDNRFSNHNGKQKIILKPFVHQVSGRAHMLTFDAKTLCKSLSKREWSFYNSLPDSLQQFTPRLKGLLFVHLTRENGSSHKFVSSDVWLPVGKAIADNQNGNNPAQNLPFPNGCGDYNPSLPCPQADPRPERECCWNSAFERTLFKGLKRMDYNLTDGFTGHAWTIDKDQEAATEALGKNPWALRQHMREINRTLKGDTLRKEVDVSKLREEVGLRDNEAHIDGERYTKVYLLLEDVTFNYQFPSVLDLKIGTQLDRAGCSQAKKDKHFNLVQKSSTGSLGLRLAGMQVYQVDAKQYLCRDKYYGRGLSTKGFNDALAQFLHNGKRPVYEVIPPMVRRLKDLRSEMEKQESFRFHASSVLLIYDSASTASIDWREGEAGENRFSRRRGEDATNKGESRLKVGVHMIDFAHSTFEGFLEDTTVYQGPDKDCLYALDNLASVLCSILKGAQATT